MKKISLIIFLFILILSLVFSYSSNEEILFSFQMFRHGARAPYLGVENGKDVYQENWPIKEELTSTGKRQLYLLGVKARSRYNNLLKEKYDPNEIYIKSTDSNRTIESIYSFLQGLYPYGTGEILNDTIINNKKIIYPPNKKYYDNFEEIIDAFNMHSEALPNGINIIPVHLINKNEKNFDLYDANLCPYRKHENAKKLPNQKMTDLAHRSINETGTLFYDLEKSNNSELLNDYWTFYKYADGFVCDDTDKRTFDFLNITYGEDIINKLRNISKEYLDICYFDINFNKEDTDVGLLSFSHTMNLILNWLSEAKNNHNKNNKKYLKYVIYSAHDISLGVSDAFMKAIFNNDIIECDFACSRIIELYLKNNEYYIRYMLANETIIFNEKYDDFINKVKQKIWSDNDINKYCTQDDNNNTEGPEAYKKKVAYNMMIFLIIVNVILILLLIAFYRHKKED